MHRLIPGCPRFAFLLLFAAFSLLLATSVPACGPAAAPLAPKKCELQIVSLNVMASPRINLTADGQPRPVQLRIYQLKNDIRLQNATFDQVWKNEKATLADDVVKVDEISVYPDTRTQVKFERDDAAHNVAGVALFRSPKGKSWFVSFELPPAPGKGMCGALCAKGDCDAGPNLTPQFSIWIDESKVDDGDGYADEFADPSRVRVVHLASKASAPPAATNAATQQAPPTTGSNQ